MPIHELAALGTAACWATSALFAADAVRALGPFHFNLLRQVFVTLLLGGTVLALGAGAWPGGWALGMLVLSGLLGILLGDTFNFAAVGRLGPRRAGAIFALNAPMAAALAWAILGEELPVQALIGIAATAAGVALAILGRPAGNAHRFEVIKGHLAAGVGFGLLAALGQASGSLLARPVLNAAGPGGGLDPYFASLIRVGASGLAMAVLAATPLAPPRPGRPGLRVLILTGAVAVIGLYLGMTLFLYALKGGQTGIVATLSATSPVLILPLLWLRTGQAPRPMSWAGGGLAVAGLALIFLR